MAGKSVRATRALVALGNAAKSEIELAAAALNESHAALSVSAKELRLDDPENARQSAIAVQAEAVRISMSALAVRAASERLAIVAQLATDAGAK